LADAAPNEANDIEQPNHSTNASPRSLSRNWLAEINLRNDRSTNCSAKNGEHWRYSPGWFCRRRPDRSEKTWRTTDSTNNGPL